MNNKISLFSITVVRNLLFTVIAVTPVFFNVTSKRIFEPDKIAVMRTLAVVTLLFFIIYLIELKKFDFPSNLKYSVSVLIAVFIFLVSEFISTVGSIVPQYSIWGSYFRQQGAYTTISYVIFFVVSLYLIGTSIFCRNFFLNVVIATSVPVSLWGILQSIGLDPIPWAVKDISIRVTSSLGNPIFLSAYLIMVFPVTLSRVIVILKNSNKKNFTNMFALTLHLFFLFIQALAIYSSKSRGPFLGFAASMIFFIFCYNKVYGKKYMRYLSVSLLVIVILISLIFVNSVMRGKNEISSINNSGAERFLNVMQTESGTGKVRLLIWKGVINLIRNSSTLRLLIGYGPESMYISYNKVYESELSKYEQIQAVPDRSHNEPFDIASSKGIIGILTFIGFYVALFSSSFRRLGILKNGKQKLFFWIFGFVLPIFITIWIVWFTVFEELAGVAIGCVLFLALILPLLNWKDNFRDSADNNITYDNKIYAIGLLSGIIGHLIEGQTGIPIVTTNLYFWIYAGSLIGILSCDSYEKTGKNTELLWSGISQNSKNQISSFIIVILLITVAFDFVSSDTNIDRGGPIYLMFIVIVWVINSLLFSFKHGTQPNDSKYSNVLKDNFKSFIYSAVLFFVFAVSYFIFIKPDTSLGHMMVSDKVADYIIFYVGAIILFLFLMTLIETIKVAKNREFFKNVLLMVCYILVVIAAGIFSYKTNLIPVKADSYYAVASTLKSSKNPDLSIPFFERAVYYNSREEIYRKSLGVAYMTKAETDGKNRQKWFEQAENEIEATCEMNKNNAHNFYIMGILYKRWSAFQKEPNKRKDMSIKAIEAFETSISLNPGRGYIYREAGETYVILGDNKKAKQYFQSAMELNSKDESSCIELGDTLRRMGQMDKAIEAYREAIKRKPDSIRAYSSIAFIHTMRNENEQAIKWNLKVLEISQHDYDAHKNLAILYERIKKYDNALSEAQKALQFAPKSQSEKIKKYIEQLKNYSKRT